VNANLTMNAGLHNIVVQAWDSSGGITKNSFTVTVATPSVTITSPVANASVVSPVQVVASSVDPSAVFTLQLYADNVLVYQTSGSGISWPLALSTGAHTLVVQVWDAAGGVYKQSVKVNVTSP
jgi:chitinase